MKNLLNRLTRSPFALVIFGLLLGILLSTIVVYRHSEHMKLKHLIGVVVAGLALHGAGAQAAGPYNGTWTGTPAYVADSGFGQAASPASTAAYITVPRAAVDEPTSGNWSVEFRFKSSSTAATVYPVNEFATGGGGWDFTIASGTGILSFVYGTGPTLNSGVNVCDGAWHHIAFVATGGTSLTLYVDGVSKATATGSGYVVAGGTITPVIAYNGAQTVDEVRISTAARYTAGFTPPTAPFTTDASTTALYHLDGDATDSSTAIATSVTIYADNAAWVASPYNWTAAGSGSSSTALTNDLGAYKRIYYASSATAALTFSSGNGCVIAYRFDGGAWTKATVTSGTATLSPPASRSPSVLLEWCYDAISGAADDWTGSPPTNSLTFTGLTLDAGATVSAPPTRPKKIILFGDSIKGGSFTLSNTGSYPVDDDVTKTYDFNLQYALNAEVGIVAFSGQAISNAGFPGSSNVPNLLNSYNLMRSGVSRSFSVQPDLCIIDEGINDGSGGTGVQAALQTIVAGVGAKKTLLVGDEKSFQSTAIAAAASALGANTAYVASPASLSLSADTFEGTHPDAQAHLTKLLPNVSAAAYPLLYGTTTTLGRGRTLK